MLFKTKFDLVVSLGEDCACSSYLRRCKLQNFSYPFDWLMSAPCKSRLDLILNNFADFFNKEDLSPLEKPKTGIVDEKCDYYADKRYGFHFLHDFRIGEPFDSEYLRVKARFERRIKRMYEQIAAAKNILFVWWSRDKRQELDFLRDYY
ncbi:MAG: hypothetical protein J6Y94_05455, partial [Bacteriovoracaceae bacterium]|nr:hypothetical protein [Bacteriovoracaceae bacterium]